MTNTVHLKDIVSILQKHKAHFQALDIFAANIAEIAEDKQVFQRVAPNELRTEVGGSPLRLQLFGETNVARVMLVPTTERPSGATGLPSDATVGAGISAVKASDSRKRRPENMLLGLLISGLTSPAKDPYSPEDAPLRTALTMEFDATAQDWKVYHGPYIAWAKAAIRAE